MEQHLELFAALAAPFAQDEVRMRPQGTRQIQYITARTVMNRLDDVVGPANWWDEYLPQQNSVICKLTIRLPDGSTLTKSDAGGYAGMSDSGDDDKSGFSDAFKRTAVKFGIGRYLYREGVPRFVHDNVHHGERPEHDPAAHQKDLVLTASGLAAPATGRGGESHAEPQSGKALFAWIKHQDETQGLDLLKSLSEWGERHDFPPRMVQWSAEQVHRAFNEAQSLIRSSKQEGQKRPAERDMTQPEPARPELETAQPRHRGGR
jgi:hypothetical protein